MRLKLAVMHNFIFENFSRVFIANGGGYIDIYFVKEAT